MSTRAPNPSSADSTRRTLHFRSLADLLADIETLDHRGDVRSIGKWTPAQNVEHIARFIDASIDGFTVKAPLLMRIAGRLVKRMVLRRPMSPGFRLPVSMEPFIPPPSTSWDEAVSHLRRGVARAGRSMMHAKSPAFGRLNHDEWERLHCRHAEMHFSFLK